MPRRAGIRLYTDVASIDHCKYILPMCFVLFLIPCRRFEACRDCITSGRTTCGFLRKEDMDDPRILLPRWVDHLAEMDIPDTDSIIANAHLLGSYTLGPWLTHLTRTRYECNHERSQYNCKDDGRDFLIFSCDRHDRRNLVHIGPHTLAGKWSIKSSLLSLTHAGA